MNQKTALTILKSGKNVFLTGSAGAGKTYLLNKYIEYLRDRGVPVSITASTGIAATHIGGQTIHSWSGLGIRDVLTQHDLEKMAQKKPLRDRIGKVQVLIIDEISMLSGDTLACIDQILRYFKTSFEPFGGIQVVFSGDFFQLPPVSKERKPSHEKFAFMHPVWVEAKLEVCYLTESHRHDESDLVQLLNEMRSGEISEGSVDLLQEKLQNSQAASATSALKLFTHNADVDAINAAELAKLKTASQYFFATTVGNPRLVESLKKSVLAPEELELKQYAQVIFVKNNYEAGYLNGTMGTVVDFDLEGAPVVETFDGKKIIAKKVEWSIVNEANTVIAQFAQIPLRLAWAITVHKSQGMTFDAAEIDLSKTFEAGQGYVALSRVKNWDGITLKGCNNRALQMDELVMRADRRFQELSAEKIAKYESIIDDKLNTIFDQFIKKCGGTLDAEEIAANRKKNNEPQKIAPKKPKVSTYEQTRTLVEAGKTLEEIVTARELTKGTIISHLEKLTIDFPALDISKFKPKKELLEVITNAIQKCKESAIAEDFDQDGRVKLGPIHRELGGEIDYEDIRLCRLFFS